MSIPHTKEYYITYGIFYLLGMLTFLPNYFVITANRYWMFKFRITGPAPGMHDDDRGPGPPEDRNSLQASFPSSYFIASQLSLIISVMLTAAYSRKLPPPDKRISAALLCTLNFYIVNLIFCKLITDRFQVAFFFIVMTIACFLGICGAVILVSLFEMVRKFPAEYYTAILTGQALCGVFSANIQIITISVTAYSIIGGIIFFGIGSLLVVITIAVFWYSKKNSEYFIYNTGNDLEVTFEHRRFFPRMWLKFKSTSRHTKICLFALSIVVGTTAMVYPGFMSLIVARDSKGQNGDLWADMYFVPVITFLLASVCDLCGRFLAAKLQKPDNVIVILVISIIRIAFIPLLILCNAQPRARFPVLFYDVPYIVFTIIASFSNGYLINLCATLIPLGTHNEEEKNSAIIMAVISAVLSTAASSIMGLILVHLI